MTEPEQSVAEAIEAGDVTAEEVAEAEVDDQTGEAETDASENVGDVKADPDVAPLP